VAPRPRVVIVGAGFAGIAAARALRRTSVDVILVDRQNYHLFSPLLYQVATALLDAALIAYPVRGIVRDFRNTSFRLADVERIDLDRKLLETDMGSVSYDYLILAAGSENNYFGNASFRQCSFGMKHLDETLAVRNHILRQFEIARWVDDPEQRRALMTIVIVGGGPTGVEASGAIAELIDKVLRKDFGDMDLSPARVVLVEAADRVLTPFDPELSSEAERRLRRKGIDVRYGSQVKHMTEGRVEFADGTSLAAGTVIWTAGVRASALADQLTPDSRGSRGVGVDKTLQVPGHPEAFVAGDMANFEDEGGRLPMLAPVAVQQAEHAARNIDRMTRGLDPAPFAYRDKGIMATVGRHAAVVQVGRLKVRGFMAWLMWLFLHLMLLVTFRNKFMTFWNWGINYLFHERPVRLIVAGLRERPQLEAETQPEVPAPVPR
jgi:NADH:ubiquinone reductase (H+-translocating)